MLAGAGLYRWRKVGSLCGETLVSDVLGLQKIMSTFDIAPRPPARLGYLDGLRGWAALVVCIFHASWQLFGTNLPGVRLDALGFFNNGFLAVFVFFVLSGVVLCQPFLRTGDLRRLQRMAIGRYPRLAIPVAASLLIAVLMSLAGLDFADGASSVAGRDNGMYGIFLQPHVGLLQWPKLALYSSFFYSEQIGYFYPVLWTMPIEIAGSFMLFGGLALLGHRFVTRLLGYGVGLVLCWQGAPNLSGFVAGAMISEFIASRAHGSRWRLRLGDAIAAVLLAGAFAAATLHHGPPNSRLFTPIAIPIVLAVVLSPRLQWLLECRVSRFLGQVSFPLYLVHMLVIVGPGSWAIVWLDAAGVSLPVIAAVVMPAVLVVSVLLAWLFLPVERFAVVASHAIARAVLP